MQATVEFRIPEELAQRYLPADCGKALGLGIARRLDLDLGDPVVAHIKQIDAELRARGEPAFFTSWEVRRHYSAKELKDAALFHVWPKRVFEPAGEECGTRYDESSACDHVFDPESEMNVSGHRVRMPASTCGAGALQVSPLFLDARRIPGTQDFARTIAGEIVASARVREVLLEAGLSGVEFGPVHQSNAGGRPSSKFFQFNVVGPQVELHPATRAGGNLFDESGYGRCPRGHVAGLNLLSEVHVQRAPEADVSFTRQLVGVRCGLLRPRPILLLTAKALRAIERAKLKGLSVEVARVS